MIKIVMNVLLSVLFVGAGIIHLLRPQVFLKAMPPYLPWHLELIYLSGVFELVLGILVLIPASRVLAAWGLIALLIAVFPANIHMALHPEEFPDIAPWVLWLRLPIQGVLIAWAYWMTRPAQ
jgi:uncharacterized membrane protein